MSTDRKRVNLTKWKIMMKGQQSIPRKLYPYEQLAIEKNEQIKKKINDEKKKEKEKTKLRNHVMMRLKYGHKGDDASIKIQRAFKRFMKDYDTLKKKHETRQAKELNNLLENYLKPQLKRSRSPNFNERPPKRTRTKQK